MIFKLQHCEDFQTAPITFESRDAVLIFMDRFVKLNGEEELEPYHLVFIEPVTIESASNSSVDEIIKWQSEYSAVPALSFYKANHNNVGD